MGLTTVQRYCAACDLAPFVLNVTTSSRPFILPLVVFPRLCSRPSTFDHVHHPSQSLISSISLDHHLYADNNLLFFAFHPLNFDSSISHLQNALQQISSWMTANLLTLNSFKIRTNFCSSDSRTNSPLRLAPPTLLEILVLSLTNI